MFVRKSTHDRIVSSAIAAERSSAAADRLDLETELTALKRALSVEESVSASLRTKLAEMAVFYELGVREQAQRDKDAARKRAKRAALRAVR